jgi:hypothetical protein
VFAIIIARLESRCASCICTIRVLMSVDCHPSPQCWLAWFICIVYSSWGESVGLLGGLEGGVGTGTVLVGFCSGSCIVLRFEGALIVGFLVVVVRLLVGTMLCRVIMFLARSESLVASCMCFILVFGSFDCHPRVLLCWFACSMY